MKKTIKTLAIILICIVMMSLCACNNAGTDDEKTTTDSVETVAAIKPMCFYCGHTYEAACTTRCPTCGILLKDPDAYTSVYGIHVYNDSDICMRCGEGKLRHWLDGFHIPD